MCCRSTTDTRRGRASGCSSTSRCTCRPPIAARTEIQSINTRNGPQVQQTDLVHEVALAVQLAIEELALINAASRKDCHAHTAAALVQQPAAVDVHFDVAVLLLLCV